MIPMESTSGYLAVERILLPEDAVCLQHLVIINYIYSLVYQSILWNPLLELIRNILLFSLSIKKYKEITLAPGPPKKISYKLMFDKHTPFNMFTSVVA